MLRHRRRIHLTDRDAIYLAVAVFVLALTTAAMATATTPAPVELAPSVLPVPIAGRNPYVAPTGPTPTPPPGR